MGGGIARAVETVDSNASLVPTSHVVYSRRVARAVGDGRAVVMVGHY